MQALVRRLAEREVHLRHLLSPGSWVKLPFLVIDDGVVLYPEAGTRAWKHPASASSKGVRSLFHAVSLQRASKQ
jgi:hypothetical protein